MEKNSQKSIKPYRYLLQGFFLVLIIVLLINFFPSHEFMIMIFGVILLITIILNTGFCGWICPLGTFVDLIRGLGKKIGSLSVFKTQNKKFKKWVRNNRAILSKIDKYARGLKYFFMLWILSLFLFDLPSAADGYLIVSIIYIVIYVILLISTFFVDRAWCRYACPLGAAIGLFSWLSPTKVTRDKELCISCNMCTRSCPMNIDVANKKSVSSFDCSTCLKCVDVCPAQGALDLKMNLPFESKKESVTTESTEKLAVK